MLRPCPAPGLILLISLTASAPPVARAQTQPFTLETALLNLVDTHYRVHGSGLDAPGFDARVSLKVDY